MGPEDKKLAEKLLPPPFLVQYERGPQKTPQVKKIAVNGNVRFSTILNFFTKYSRGVQIAQISPGGAFWGLFSYKIKKKWGFEFFGKFLIFRPSNTLY